MSTYRAIDMTERKVLSIDSSLGRRRRNLRYEETIIRKEQQEQRPSWLRFQNNVITIDEV